MASKMSVSKAFSVAAELTAEELRDGDEHPWSYTAVVISFENDLAEVEVFDYNGEYIGSL